MGVSMKNQTLFIDRQSERERLHGVESNETVVSK